MGSFQGVRQQQEQCNFNFNSDLIERECASSKMRLFGIGLSFLAVMAGLFVAVGAVVQSQKGRKFDLQESEDPFFRFGNVGERPVTPPITVPLDPQEETTAEVTTTEIVEETQDISLWGSSNDGWGDGASSRSLSQTSDWGSDSWGDSGDSFSDGGGEDSFGDSFGDSLGDSSASSDPWSDTWGDDDDFFPEFELPPCSTLTADEIEFGIECDGNATEPVPEVRIRDTMFERLFYQLWEDTQLKMNNDAAINGMSIDPLDVDAQMPEPIDQQQSGAGYDVHIQMTGLKVYGLSGINLTETLVTRSENLTDFDMTLTFTFDQLVINGTYNLTGNVLFGGPLTSNGWKPFRIAITEASVSNRIKMELIDPAANWDSRSCSDNSFIFDDPNVLITEIGMPLAYKDVNFRFEGLGAFANNMINGVGIYMLQTQEDTIKKEIRKNIKKEVNSLIC